MQEYDITKLPFTSISRENWQMLVDLDAETLYDVIQNVGSYVLTGEKCDCDNTLSRVVCNQLISVIDRKGRSAKKSANNLNKANAVLQEKRKSVEQPVKEQSIQPNEEFSNPVEAVEESEPQKPKRTMEEKRQSWAEKIMSVDNPSEIYPYWRRLFKTEDEAKAYIRSHIDTGQKKQDGEIKENDIDISPQVKDFLDWVDKDEWVKIINIIRRGLYYHRQSDLDYANDLLLQHFINYGIWDGDNGVPIDEEVCKELLNYIKAITVEPKVF